MQLVSPPIDDGSKRLTTALLLSFVLHCLFLTLIRPPVTAIDRKPIEIQYIPLPSALPESHVPRQIVSPSDAPVGEPLKSAYLSDKDSRTEKEQIRRGTPEPVNTVKSPLTEKSTAVKAQPEKPAQKAKESRKKDFSLSLSAADLEKTLGTSKLKRADDGVEMPSISKEALETKEAVDAERQAKLQEYAPFRKGAISGGMNSAFSLRQGSPDFLPTVPDGDITLLNTKADRFAVFVRRVALQVFGNLRKNSWAEIPYQEVVRLQDYVTVHAVMSPTGKLMGVTLETTSGSTHFDRVVRQAAEAGAIDQNPPPNAVAEDGNIHFVFKARTWSRVMPNGIGEQRWLMLGTGLL